MVREICKDEAFLAQKAEPATKDDLGTAQDLLDTLLAHKDGCVGMAANMIIKMLEMFSLYDVGLTLGCMGIACVAFSLVYVLVYQLTAKVYYRTVKW